MIEGQLYQLGYVCDDLEAGIAQFRGRGMRHEPRVIEVDHAVDTPRGKTAFRLRICFIWIGEIQYELIQPLSDPLGIYADTPPSGGPLRFHQLCFRVRDWADFRARVDRQDLPVAIEHDAGGDGLKFLYLDGRSRFGHYLEYTWMTDQAWEQIRAM